MSYTIPRRTVIQYLAGLSAGVAVGFGTRGLADDTVRPTGTKRAKGKSGIVSVMRGTADLVVPQDGEGFRYGTGYVFQAGSRTIDRS